MPAEQADLEVLSQRPFFKAGADVAVCGGHPKKADILKETADQEGKRLLTLGCDITDRDKVEGMLNEIERELGGLDILVNSAGMNRLIPAEDYEEEVFSQVMDLNVLGIHTVTRAVGKRFMIPAGYGRILNLSSVKGLIGTGQDYLAYCTSKGAVNMYTRQLACEWGKYNITCNAIAPTFVRTPINAFQLDESSVLPDTDKADSFGANRTGRRYCGSCTVFMQRRLLICDRSDPWCRRRINRNAVKINDKYKRRNEL